MIKYADIKKESVEVNENKDYLVSIYHDTDFGYIFDPMEQENLSLIYCFHNHYKIGNQHKYNSPGDMLLSLAKDLQVEIDEENDTFESIEEKIRTKAILRDLYMYDHSGITISLSPFSCNWDSGQVGVVYVPYSKIQSEYGEINEENIKKANERIQSEIEYYDEYLRGNVYGVSVYKKNKCHCNQENCTIIEHELIESCGGFIGYDFKKSGIYEYIKEETGIEI